MCVFTLPVFNCSKLTKERPKLFMKSVQSSMTSFWCLYRWHWIDSIHCSGASVVGFEQVIAGWVNQWEWLITLDSYFFNCILIAQYFIFANLPNLTMSFNVIKAKKIKRQKMKMKLEKNCYFIYFVQKRGFRFRHFLLNLDSDSHRN